MALKKKIATLFGIMAGLIIGLGCYTFIYAKGYFYLTDDPSACADCHMPYKRVGALKISDHNVQSPVLNINRACQTCHKWSEEELKARVETIQDKTFRMRNLAMDALIALIGDIKKAKEVGRTDAELNAPRRYQRKAQFYLDFVEAENSTGFHAPQETMRILGESINFSRMGQVSLKEKSNQ
jgi:nitrite reductase (cytochrome c-552)